MESTVTRHGGVLLLGAAVVITAWGTIGFFQGLRVGFSGGLYGPRYIVEGVMPGGPGQKAGLRPGDRIISVEGRPIEDVGMESRWPLALSPRAGETRRFVVEREGLKQTIDVVYAAPPRQVLLLRLSGALIVISFLGSGLWAFFSLRTTHALALAQIGLAAAAMYMSPNLGAWNGLNSLIQGVAAVLWVALLLRFFLHFPQPKRWSHNRLTTYATFGVCGLVLVLYVVEIAVHPLFYYVAGEVMSLLMLVYVVLILAALTHTVVKTPRAELWKCGMGWILVGLLVAIAPNLVAFFGPRLPGSGYSLALLAVIPLTMALALRKHARVGEAQKAADAA